MTEKILDATSWMDRQIPEYADDIRLIVADTITENADEDDINDAAFDAFYDIMTECIPEGVDVDEVIKRTWESDKPFKKALEDNVKKQLEEIAYENAFLSEMAMDYRREMR